MHCNIGIGSDIITMERALLARYNRGCENQCLSKPSRAASRTVSITRIYGWKQSFGEFLCKEVVKYS